MATQPFPSSLPVPTHDERTMAFLAHLLQVFTGFIAPLVIYCVKQDSRFVKFHALQSLVWQLCYMALFFIGFIFIFVFMFTSILHEGAAGGHSQGPPPAFLLFFPFFWVFWGLGWVANIIFGVVYGIKANRGEWAPLPIIGNWFLPKLDPGAQPPSQPWMP